MNKFCTARYHGAYVGDWQNGRLRTQTDQLVSMVLAKSSTEPPGPGIELPIYCESNRSPDNDFFPMGYVCAFQLTCEVISAALRYIELIWEDFSPNLDELRVRRFCYSDREVY